MALTQETFNGDGSNLGPFSFTFKWLRSSDIKVSVNGVLKTAGTHYNLQNLNYTTKTGGQVLFTAGNAPAAGTGNIRIYRSTDSSALASTFGSGSAIRAVDLNDNFTQVLYYSEETQTFAEGTDASSIQATANTALNNANSAVSTANAAQATANAASTTANGIAATANSALSAANSAATTANAALPKAGGTMTGGITFAAGQPTATTAVAGIVQLDSSISSTSTTTAATPSAVKQAYDLANTAQTTALPKAGGTMTGDVVFTSTQTYPRIPQNAKTSAYTLIASDAGKHIFTTANVTVPANVFTIGDTVDVYNNSGINININASGVNIRLAGTATVGNRVLAQRGYATLVCIANNEFVAHGTGLT